MVRPRNQDSQRRRTQRLRALQRAMDSDSESDAESVQGWSLPGVEVVHVEGSLPVSTPMEATPRAPPRQPDSIVPPTTSPIPNRVEADRPVLRPSRRLVLVADGEHVEASTQPVSFVPTWRDATDNEDMVDALQHYLEGDPQRAQSGWAEVEQDFGELNHFDMTVADSDADASSPENPGNSGSGSVTLLASTRRNLLG